MKIASAGSAPQTSDGPPEIGSAAPAALLLAALALLAAFILVVPYTPRSLQGSDIFSQLSSTLSGGTQTTTTGPSTTSTQSVNPACAAISAERTPAAPDISNGSAHVYYPSDYCALAAYILTVINQDRATNGSSPVSLDYNQAAQQHADSMLWYDYFSHFDTQGLKPYMRYSMLGGSGGDFENVAYLSYSANHFTSTGLVEESIHTLEESMMYNDSTCCNNGHRDNILSSLHNRVSIGVAYNGTTVFFDEEFENSYASVSFTVSSSADVKPYYVTISGTPTSGAPSPDAIYIAFDPTPSAETPATLNAGPHEYGPGTLTGGVLPASGFPPTCGTFENGITVCADTWLFAPTGISIKFPMERFVTQYGPGVYTIYLITGASTNTAIMMYSTFAA